MDRISDPTHAIDLFGAGKHGFTNGDPLAGISATFLNAEWFNGVQENPLRVIEAVGIALAAGDHTQLTKAIKRLAGGNVTSLAASAVLTADQSGLVLVSAAAGNVILTLPAANAAGGVPLRFTICRTDTSANTVTVQRAGADTIEGSATPLDLPPVERLSLIGDGAIGWRLQVGRFTQSLAVNGWARMPNGLILQWGQTAFGDIVFTGIVNTTFPIAFPSACLQVLPAAGMTGGFYVHCQVDEATVTSTGFTAVVSETETVQQTGLVVRWFALGH